MAREYRLKDGRIVREASCAEVTVALLGFALGGIAGMIIGSLF